MNMFNLDVTFAAWHGIKGITSEANKKRGNQFMGTQKASSTGKPGKTPAKSSAKEKGSKSVSKLSSIKQALFGGAASKKSSHPSVPAKAGKKEPAKNVAKPAKPLAGTKQNNTSKSKEHASHHSHHLAPTTTHNKKAMTHESGKKVEGDSSIKKGISSAHSAKGSLSASSLRAPYLEAGEAVCREVACEGLATSGGYCRLHYIKNWKKIKRKEVILKEGKLNQYIEELVAKYPDKYIEAIRQDLANDKDFAKVIYDLDLDESLDEFDVDGENSDHIIDSIKRDFDDEGDSGF